MSKITILLAICYFCLAKADLTDTKELSREKCQNVLYARSQVSRFCVPENLTSWSTQYPEYQPPFYEATSLMGKPWADPLIGNIIIEEKKFLDDFHTSKIRRHILQTQFQ